MRPPTPTQPPIILVLRHYLYCSGKARIKITLKNGVLDPQGKAIEGAVKGLGISGVSDVRQGKYIEVDLTEKDPAKAKVLLEQMCKDLLANTVIENYSYEIG